MVRFIEMKGIYLDETESFGFYNTVTDKFINVGGLFVFDSCAEFYNAYDDNCEFDFERLNSKITNEWRSKIYDAKRKKYSLVGKFRHPEFRDKFIQIKDISFDTLPNIIGYKLVDKNTDLIII